MRVVSITSSPSEQMRASISRMPSGSFIAILPLRMTLVKSSSALRRTSPSEVANMICRLAHSVLGRVHRHDGGDPDPAGDRQDVDDRLAPRVAAAERQPPGLELVGHAVGGEDQQRRVGAGDEQRGDEVLVLGRHAGGALAAPALGAVLGQRRALDVAAGGDGHRHVLALDQVLVLDVGLDLDDLRAARHGEELASPRAARRR